MEVASKVGNLPSKFGHAFAFWKYARGGWTDRRRTKAMLIAPFPMVGGIIMTKENNG